MKKITIIELATGKRAKPIIAKDDEVAKILSSVPKGKMAQIEGCDDEENLNIKA